MTPHGTLNRYTYHKCRCDECRAVNAAYQRQYQQRNRCDCDECVATRTAEAELLAARKRAALRRAGNPVT